MTPADYEDALVARRAVRTRYAALRCRFDAVVTLGATGATPVGLDWAGELTANVPASLLGVPAIGLPLLRDEGLPLGLQLIGHYGEDAALLSLTRSLWKEWNA